MAMATSRVERRLAAILAADVVGYSRLMEADERATLARLKAHRSELIDPLLSEHRGRLVKLMGDGALCEFASAVDAVECAAGIQGGMAEREAAVPEGERIRFRIGINLGDVIVAGEDIYGDGVNVAARLEQLAEPGGVVVSGTTFDHLRGGLGRTFAPLGEQRLKNIERPVRAYRMVLGGSADGPPERPALPLPDKPSLAVLPFENLSGDAEQGYFADGIVEDVITALSKVSGLFVIARNSSFAYRGKTVDVRQVGRELGVRYVLEGSVKRAGDRVRVTAQLVDARTGGHVWAEQYDRPLGDIFAVQDEVTAAIAARLGATIERAEADLARRKAPADLGAYDYYLQGRMKRSTSDKAQLLEARELFQRVVALDPAFAPAYAELAHSYYTEVALRWDPPHREEALAEGFALARKAVELDPTLALGHLTMGNLHLRRHDYDEAAGWAERAIALGPNDPENYAGLANIYSFMGRAADALALMRKAVELDPNYPPRYGMYLGRAYLFTRQLEAAVLHLRDAASRAPDYWPAHLYLAAAYGHLGRADEAAAALAAVRRQTRLASLRDADPADDYRAGPEKDYFLQGLALAGLPRE